MSPFQPRTVRTVRRAALLAALAMPLLAGAAGATDAPPGYVVVRSVSTGRALTAHKPKATTVRAALREAVQDLQRWTGRVRVLNAYEDVRDHRAGGAGFEAQVGGRPVKGFVSARLRDRGASVAVVYANADAPRSDWARLLAPQDAAPPAGQAAQAEPPARAQERAGGSGGGLRTHRFPDGTCTVGLADGWRTESTSCVGGFLLTGPGDQSMQMSAGLSVSTPDSMAAQTQRQLEMNARRMGSRLPPSDLLVAPFTGPLEAVRNLAPQLSAISARHGGPAFQADHLEQAETIQAFSKGGRAARLTWGVTEKGRDGRVRHYKAEGYAETSAIGQGAWTLFISILRAPDATFDRDLPVMRAMARSVTENAQAIQQKTQQNIQAQNQRFQAQQQAHRQQVEAFDARQKAYREVQAAQDRRNRSWEENQTRRARSNDDFDEYVRGYRTVEDTRTGEKTSVDLGNVDRIVDRLNEGDPGRYRQIPLRDEADPLR
jgi:hypothetical protein